MRTRAAGIIPVVLGHYEPSEFDSADCFTLPSSAFRLRQIGPVDIDVRAAGRSVLRELLDAAFEASPGDVIRAGVPDGERTVLGAVPARIEDLGETEAAPCRPVPEEGPEEAGDYHLTMGVLSKSVAPTGCSSR